MESIFLVRRIVTSKNKVMNQTTYYTTILDTTAEQLLKISREHRRAGSIHWKLDVILSEDECEMLSENRHKSLNTFRKLALFVHKKHMAKQYKKSNIKASLVSCLLNEKYLCRILQNL